MDKTLPAVAFLILPISKALIALWFLEIGHIGCMLFSNVTYKEIRFMIGLVFTIGNIFLSQQNNGLDLNNMSLGIHPPLFFVTGIIGSFGALFVFEFLELLDFYYKDFHCVCQDMHWVCFFSEIPFCDVFFYVFLVF